MLRRRRGAPAVLLCHWPAALSPATGHAQPAFTLLFAGGTGLDASWPGDTALSLDQLAELFLPGCGPFTLRRRLRVFASADGSKM